jgi:hypothetical protein
MKIDYPKSILNKNPLSSKPLGVPNFSQRAVVTAITLANGCQYLSFTGTIKVWC